MVIYTRNATCAPIRAEEGITGILTPPNTTTSFRDLPSHQQIGGYPTIEQLSAADHDPTSLDAEGRCVILEFPAFVLIGTYCPAERDETRTHFRTSFLRLVDARIRNLVKMGKRVVWTGDLNISREEIDTAAAEENMRKANLDSVEWMSHPARRIFNQLLVGGRVYGERDEGREIPVMWDLCRGFHEGRRGMYTCWETKVNARPGNYGARIDYVLCSADMKDWFCDANIQEGLMGSDHCPVYAVLKDEVPQQLLLDNDGLKKHANATTHILDVVNPPGMFAKGVRRQQWSTKCLLPMSGKLIPEFDKRRSIRDMLMRKPTISTPRIDAAADSSTHDEENMVPSTNIAVAAPGQKDQDQDSLARTFSETSDSPAKRKVRNGAPLAVKRPKTTSQPRSNSTTRGGGKGQQSLKGFFSSKPPQTPRSPADGDTLTSPPTPQLPTDDHDNDNDPLPEVAASRTATTSVSVQQNPSLAASSTSKETWGKLFSKPVIPQCEHGEPCKTMTTKKSGINCGRSFWMCNRPLGPSGQQEKGTEWRCSTFIWASDWDSRGSSTILGMATQG